MWCATSLPKRAARRPRQCLNHAGIPWRFEMLDPWQRSQNKRSANQGRSLNPRQGAYRTAPDQRPLSGTRLKLLLRYFESLSTQVGGFREKQLPDARASFRLWTAVIHLHRRCKSVVDLQAEKQVHKHLPGQLRPSVRHHFADRGDKYQTRRSRASSSCPVALIYSLSRTSRVKAPLAAMSQTSLRADQRLEHLSGTWNLRVPNGVVFSGGRSSRVLPWSSTAALSAMAIHPDRRVGRIVFVRLRRVFVVAFGRDVVVVEINLSNHVHLP